MSVRSDRIMPMTTCLLLDDAPQSGAWNMAVDEALLAAADDRGEAAIRFYRWNEPTLSLGYFQAAADRAGHAASRDLPLVRRQSGGGALVHDRELTYSIALPATHPVTRQPPQLYRLTHDALTAALGAQGVAVRPVGCGCSDEAATSCGEAPAADSPEPFLCFARRHPLDLIAADNNGDVAAPKFVGSAQRRRRGALLQHGSLLLAKSAAAPELPGVQDVCGRDVDVAALVDAVAAQLLDSLQLAVTATAPPRETKMAAEELAAQKYSSSGWNRRR